MKLLNKLERKFGRYAIPNLMKYIAILFGAGLLLGMISPNLDTFMNLNFAMIMEGQIWRLITFIIPITSSNNIFFVLISAYFYYMIGNALEQTWGAFRLNLYFFSGILFNILGSFIIFILTGMSAPVSLTVVCGTLFFAFAALFPNTKFMMYFLIPIKAKYLAWFQGALYILDIFNYIAVGYIIGVLPILLSVTNFLIFYFASKNVRRISPSELNRKAKFRKQMNEARKKGPVTQHNGQAVITRHKCAVCGKTELDDDQLEFRFCSKCNGNYEYCMEHLFSHEHVKR